MTEDESYVTGAERLAAWGCETREQKLERACMALMEQLNMLHVEHKDVDLSEDEDATCSCADAWRMGAEALKP